MIDFEYRQFFDPIFTVGFQVEMQDLWIPDSDHETRESAQNRVDYLNNLQPGDKIAHIDSLIDRYYGYK